MPLTTTYPLPLPTVQLLIAGQDYTPFVLARTLTIHMILGAQSSTASFEIKPPESYRGTSPGQPSVGQAVMINVGTDSTPQKQAFSSSQPYTTVFGGTLSSAESARIAAQSYK